MERLSEGRLLTFTFVNVFFACDFGEKIVVITSFAVALCINSCSGKSNTALIKVRELEGYSLAIAYLEDHDGSAICRNPDAGDLRVKTFCGRCLRVGSGVSKKYSKQYSR